MMKAEEFIKKLKLTEPLLTEASDNFLIKAANKFKTIVKKGDKEFNFEIESIVNNYSVNGVSTRFFRFLDTTKVLKDYIFFAECEADYMVLCSTTKEVVLIDHETFDFYEMCFESEPIIMKVANSQENFLKCLILSFELSKKVSERGFCIDEEDKTTALECIKIAGGKDYNNFWHYFFSVD
jgi:hypothetical protein